jgi:hypothetical protein
MRVGAMLAAAGASALPELFAWHASPANTTTQLRSGASQLVADGELQWPVRNIGGEWASARFSYLPGLVTKEEARELLSLLRESEFDTDPDTVDGMSTHELYLERHGGFGEAHLGLLTQKPDADSAVRRQREPLRAEAREITRRIVEERITPWIERRYAEQCAPSSVGEARRCTPCFSIVRR